MKDKKIQELEQSFATLLGDLNKVKADMGEMENEGPDMEEKMQRMMDAMSRIYVNLSDRISYLADGFFQYTYDHNKGHIPPIKSATTMTKALKALGMEGDYEINKPWVSVAKNSKGILSVVANFVKNETPKV